MQANIPVRKIKFGLGCSSESGFLLSMHKALDSISAPKEEMTERERERRRERERKKENSIQFYTLSYWRHSSRFIHISVM
jgi:hypothetical protein